MQGDKVETALVDWEEISDAYSFVFYSCDRSGRVRYVNRAWHDFAERNASPEFLVHSGVNQNLLTALSHSEVDPFLHSYEVVRHGDVSHLDQIVPCHAPNQNRWMLMRLQRMAEEFVFSCYFLRYYGEEAPRDPKIRCLTDGGNFSKKWAWDSAPIREGDSIALCPNCSLQFYTHLRESDSFAAEI